MSKQRLSSIEKRIDKIRELIDEGNAKSHWIVFLDGETVKEAIARYEKESGNVVNEEIDDIFFCGNDNLIGFDGITID